MLARQAAHCTMGAVIVVHACAVVAAPQATVAGALRSVDVLQASAAGLRVEVPCRRAGLLEAEDVVRLRAPGLPFWLAMRLTRVDLDGVQARRQSGPFADVRYRSSLLRTSSGTRLTLRLSCTGRLAEAPGCRRMAQAALRARIDAVGAAAHHLATAEEVVAAAVVRQGRVLLARRRGPVALAGQWELPGGKASAGEDPRQALRRELMEELGVTSEIGAQLGADVPLRDGRVLRAYQARLTGGVPETREHSALRWAASAQLWRLDMVANDRGWRQELAALLASTDR